MHLPVLQLSAVLVATPFASGQAADQIFSQATWSSGIDSGVAPHVRFEVGPNDPCGTRLLMIHSGPADEESLQTTLRAGHPYFENLSVLKTKSRNKRKSHVQLHLSLSRWKKA